MKRLIIAMAFLAAVSGCNITVRTIREQPTPSFDKLAAEVVK